MVQIRVSFEGVEAVREMISPQGIQRATRSGLQAAMQELARQSQRTANEQIYARPVNGGTRTRDYERSLHIGSRGNIARIDYSSNVIEFGTETDHSAFVEYDTRPHVIRPRTARALSFAPVVGHSLGVLPIRRGSKVTPRGTGFFRGARGSVVAKPGKFSTVTVKSVNHPGTKGLHVLELASSGASADMIFQAYSDAFAASLERRA